MSKITDQATQREAISNHLWQRVVDMYEAAPKDYEAEITKVGKFCREQKLYRVGMIISAAGAKITAQLIMKDANK